MRPAEMRLDRSLTTGVFHPLQRAGLGTHGCRLPVLMYHGISDNPEMGVSGYYKTNTAPQIFRRHMQYLAEAGYQTIDLTQLVEGLRANHLAANAVVITFDDGFRNFYTEAWPVLNEHRFTATMFLPTAFILPGGGAFKETACLTWNEVRELRKAGMSFGSHTVNHPKLRELTEVQIERELRDSKLAIEEQLGEPVTTFAYPYAFPQENREFASVFKTLLQQAGYDCCVTTQIGRVKPGDDPYRLKRLPANSLDDAALFQAKLEGGYDWLALPQAFVKKMNRRRQPAAPALS